LGPGGAQVVAAPLPYPPPPALALAFSHPFQIKWTPDENAQLSIVTPVVVSACAVSSKSPPPLVYCDSGLWTRRNGGRCG